MGMIINIDVGLENRTDYNILREPINDMLKNMQEAWEQKNPIDLLYKRGTIGVFQETYTSSLGFAHAFRETNDYAVAPIFNTQEGFSKVYTTRTFQGGFIITQQLLEDQQYNNIKNTASQFMTRWHGDQVEYALTAMFSGFGVKQEFGDDTNGGTSVLLMTSADTADGDIMNGQKNPLFTNNHTIVKRKGMSAQDLFDKKQSNLFYIKDGDTNGLDLDGDDPGKVAKLADIINQAITIGENYVNDNGKFVANSGRWRIVAPNDARLKGMLKAALSMEMLHGLGPNPALDRADLEVTPYLRNYACCFDKTKQRGVGFFIVNPSYNAENNGPEFTQRVALTLNVEQKKNPYGISYDARERFDINCASWRGIIFVYIGATSPTTWVSSPSVDNTGAVTTKTGFNAMTALTPIATIVKPVSVQGTVQTEAAGG